VICGSIYDLKWIRVKVEHKSSLLKKLLWILNQIVIENMLNSQWK
jgi:hypothetical protein